MAVAHAHGTSLLIAHPSAHILAPPTHTDAGDDLEARTHAGKSLLMACVDGDKPEAATWLLAQWRRRMDKPVEELLEGRSAVGYTPLWCVHVCVHARVR